MKIIDGTNAVMGRLASCVAKQALQGEEIVVLNCNKVIITGNKARIQEEFTKKRNMVGSSQKGPKHIRNPERIVKRAIRGMLPDHREGRGREAWKRIRCYNAVPVEFSDKEHIQIKGDKRTKYSHVKEFV